MSTPGAVLSSFAYGEHLDGPYRRSLGYRLLAPVEPQAWSAEVEALARWLQAAPYPDHWPPTDLFCSVILADGQRLVAVARYGLADHTPGQRRGGLELVGVIGPASLSMGPALAIYRWLMQRRLATEDLRSLGGPQALADALAAVPPMPAPTDPVPVLPIRLWQEGALLFAASAPSDPDHRLGLLEQVAAGAWQWLPLVGADFPLANYARRGPLIAWTPHLASVAVKFGQKPTDEVPARVPFNRSLIAALAGAILVLLAANLWAMLSLSHKVSSAAHPVETAAPPREGTTAPAAGDSDSSRQRWVLALHRLLHKHDGQAELSAGKIAERYEHLTAIDKDLRVSSPEGKEVVVSVDGLSRRGADRIKRSIRKALKGIDPRLIDLACQQVQEQLNADTLDGS